MGVCTTCGKHNEYQDGPYVCNSHGQLDEYCNRVTSEPIAESTSQLSDIEQILYREHVKSEIKTRADIELDKLSNMLTKHLGIDIDTASPMVKSMLALALPMLLHPMAEVIPPIAHEALSEISTDAMCDMVCNFDGSAAAKALGAMHDAIEDKQDAAGVPYNSYTKSELINHAVRRGLNVTDRMHRTRIIELLVLLDAG